MKDLEISKNTIVINGRFLTQKMTGAQRFAQEITIHILEQYKNFVVVTPKNIIHKELAERLNAKIVNGFKGHLWEQITLRNYLVRNGSPLLINLSFTGPYFYNNNVLVIHDMIYQFKAWVSKSFYYYYSFLIPRIALKAVHIFTVSNFSKNDIINKLNIENENIDVVYDAVSKSFQKTNNQNNYGKYILGVSTMNKRKNFHGLISGFLESKLDDYKLVLVGSEDSKIYSHIEFEKYKDLDKIIFTGYVSESDLIDLYSNAELFVYPSFYEGFGLPPIEAMACGCPTAVSNVTSLPEVCADASIYFDPIDVKSIATAIQKIIYDPNLKNQLINKGYKNIKRFDWNNSSKKMVEKINEKIKVSN